MKDDIKNSWAPHPGFESHPSAQQDGILPLDHSAAFPVAFNDVVSNPTPGTQLVRAHGTLNEGGLYPVFFAGATERPWISLNK